MLIDFIEKYWEQITWVTIAVIIFVIFVVLKRKETKG
jgi:hypothetical protein